MTGTAKFWTGLRFNRFLDARDGRISGIVEANLSGIVRDVVVEVLFFYDLIFDLIFSLVIVFDL